MDKRGSKSKGSIKAKLIGIIIPMIVVLMSSLIIISYNKSKSIITNAAHDLLETSTKKQVDQIESWLNENLEAFKSVKASIEGVALNDVELQKLLNQYYRYNDNYPEGFYIGYENGNILKAKDSNKSSKNILDSVWYKEGITRINMAFGSPYKDENGKNTISASGILDDNSGKVKILSVDLYLDKISIIVNSMIEMDNAEAFLIDNSNKTILAHSDSSLISTKIDSDTNDTFLKGIATKIQSEQKDFFELDKNMVVVKEISGTDWMLVSYVPTESILGELLKLRSFMIVIGVVSIMILAFLIERGVQIVIKPIKKLTETVVAMTNGDFTVDVELKGNDEISIMMKSVKEFIEVMRAMINNISVASNRMNEQAEGSILISKELYDSSKLQFQSMQNLNNAADQLATSVTEIAENTTTLASVVSTTRDDSIKVEQRMKDTISISEKGRKDMEKVNDAMDNIRKSIRDLQESINNVGKSSSEITNIVNVIGDIAEQTNLLSLNASIEAARAGESGKGFAVVATEIGKLAKTSSDSVQNISSLISGINNLVSETVKQSDESAGHINESSYLVSSTADTFDSIFDTINSTNNLIQDMIEKIGHLDSVAATVASVSEEQAATSQEILATSEIMVSQSDRVTKNSQRVADDAEKLSDTANELENQVQMFKI